MKSSLYQTFLFFFFLAIFSAYPAEKSVKIKPWKVRQVAITGNEAFKRFELLQVMDLRPVWFKNPRFSKARLRSDLESLEKLYNNQGFLFTKVSAVNVVRDSLKKRVFIFIHVDEGPRTMVAEVTYIPQLTDTILLKGLKCRPGKPLIQRDILDDERTIRQRWAKRGHLFAKVRSRQEIDSINLSASISFSLEPGPLVVADSLYLSGLEGLKPRVVRREITFKAGDTLTLDDLRRSERRLYGTNLLNSVSIEPEVHDTADTISSDTTRSCRLPVSVTVRETNFLRLKLRLGYGQYEKFRSSVEASYNNLFGVGHRLAFKGNLSQRIQQAKMIYTTPWFLGIPLRFDGSFYYNRFSDTTTYRGLFRGVLLSLERATEFNTTWQFWTKLEDVLWISSDGLPEDLPDKNTQSFGIDLTYDTRNNLLNPSKGFYTLLKSELAGITGMNSNQFIKFTGDTRLYWQLKKLKFASGCKLGWARPYGKSRVVPLQDQFYGGGSRSVRGFRDNFLRTFTDSTVHAKSGTIMATANLLEIRFPIVGWVNGALFCDAGYLWDSVNGRSPRSLAEDLRWTAGPGIRVNTPLAILRFDVGFKLDKRRSELLAQWHLDVGQSF